MPECDGLSWLETNILVTKFDPPKQKILAPPLSELYYFTVYIKGLIPKFGVWAKLMRVGLKKS